MEGIQILIEKTAAFIPNETYCTCVATCAGTREAAAMGFGPESSRRKAAHRRKDSKTSRRQRGNNDVLQQKKHTRPVGGLRLGRGSSFDGTLARNINICPLFFTFDNANFPDRCPLFKRRISSPFPRCCPRLPQHSLSQWKI